MGKKKMKIGLFAALGAFILCFGLMQTSAHALTLPAKLNAESAVTQATFWRLFEEEHPVHKRHHHHGHHHHYHHVKKKH
jgi:hypothetical protein